MNPKLEKLGIEIAKTKAKIETMQARLREMEKQKTELENTDYVSIARSYNMTPAELAEFLKAMRGGPSNTLPVGSSQEEAE